MIPLGAIHFSPAEVAMILAIVVAGAIVFALPATLTLAWIGHRRADRHPGAAAFWYWLAGTGLSLATTGLAAQQDLGWWAVPLGWVPTLLVAALLNPRWPRRRARLGATTTGQQRER
ncbi:hypothetical protein [Kribbella sp. NPDC048915]|uniref:hypothetical protein n=1 Tax=Kribbella sp. NPDC048915 TaxID=3155148 RepID=UPI0033CD09D1